MRKCLIIIVGVASIVGTAIGWVVIGCYAHRNLTLPPAWICKDGYLWERQLNSKNDKVYVRHNRYCVEVE